MKINIWVSEDSKPFTQKKSRKNEINFPRVSCVALVCSTLSAKSCSYSHPVIILLCVRCSYWLCSVSMNHWVTQRGSGMEANLGCMLLWDLSSGATSAFLTVHIPGSLSFSASLWRKFISWKYSAATWDLTHRCLIFKQFSLSKVLLCICCPLNFPLYTLANEGQQRDKIRVQQVVAAITDGS